MSGLAWRTHVRPVVMPPGDLVVLSEHAHHVFDGDAYVRAASLLDGRCSDEEIHARLEGEGVAAEPARLAVAHLRALGLIGETAGPLSAIGETALWDALGEDAVAAQARLEAARVAVRDVGGTGTDMLREALGAAGVTLAHGAGPADLLVAVVDDYLDPGLEAANHEALAAGRPWLTVRLVGTVLWLGPLYVPRQTGCWQCLAQRMRHNRQTESFVEEQLGPSARAPLPAIRSSVRLAAVLATAEIVRWLATERHDGLVGGLLAVDLKTNALVRHALVRRPQCRACGEGAPRSTPVQLVPSAKRDRDSGRLTPAAVTLAQLEHHVSPLTGAVRALFESSEHGYLHVAAAHALPMGRYDFRVLRDNLLGRSGGKGFDRAHARCSALCEALERYSGIWQGEEEAVVASVSYDALGDRAADPLELCGFSAAQYAARDAWNAANDEPHAWVPRPFDRAQPIDWVALSSLSHARARLCPAAYCYYGHPDMRHMFCASDSNGCAAGATRTEAVAHGLLELIERDAAAIWWYNRLRRPAVDLDAFGLELVRRLRDIFDAQRRAFWALDLTADIGVPVFAAISARLDGPVEDIIYGFGADFDPAAALTKALLEMHQSLFGVLGATPGAAGSYRTDRSAARRWFASATLADQPYLVPDPATPARSPDAFEAPAGRDWLDDVERTVERLRDAGLETLVLDQTRADIGLAVCRVVVPGLCHFWRRFGNPRLYEVPVRLGWRGSPTAEVDLNPWFIYF